MYSGLVDYVIAFLLGEENAGLARFVQYGKPDAPRGEDTRVFILASSFFDRDVYLGKASLPALPLARVEGLPLLFGDGMLREENGVATTSADLVASSFFLLSRYEEVVRKEVRDGHGRFPGKESLPYRAGFIRLPLVDEYGRLLRGWLRRAGVSAVEPERGYRSIALTHDVDVPWLPLAGQARLALGLAKGLLKGKRYYRGPFLRHFGRAEKQSGYTFPWLIAQDAAVKERCGDACESIYFLLFCDKSRQDNPYIKRNPGRSKALLEMLLASGAEIGLHASYAAGLLPHKVRDEREGLSAFAGRAVTRSRHHFLSCREPADFEQLTAAGIRDDYSMGYSDVSGFRLGTCRPVRWMDPVKLSLTPLILHPLTIMECTLDRKGYMNLDEQAAYEYAAGLADSVREHGGELVLLWHNTEVSESSTGYHRALYQRLLAHVTGQGAEEA